MGSLSVSTHVSAPVERVFAVCTDIGKTAERIPDIVAVEMLTEGPFRVGTRWRETRVMFKKQATEEMWVTSVDPPRSHTVEAESHGMRYSTRFSFVPDGDGTEVRWDFTGTPLTLGTKLLSPVLDALMKGTMRKCMLRDLEALRGVAESNPS